MNPLNAFSTVLALASLAGCATLRPYNPDRTATSAWEARFAALPTDYKPTEPYDHRELKRLAAHPRENPRRLMWLINRAGAEQDSRFRHLPGRREVLLDQQKPHHAHALALSLSGLDYSVNNNQAALEIILDDLARQPVGSDADAVVVLAFIDEWDRTTSAILTHFVRTDGAGSIARGNFWWTREYLFPKNFASSRR